MPYFHKTFGQNMHCKTPDELTMSKGHLLFNSVLLVILVGKSDILSINAYNSVVANGNFMGVTS